MFIRHLFILLILFGFAYSTATAQQHLEPERGSLNDFDFALDHAKTLQNTLLKDASKYYRARVVCLPSFKSAWTLTLTRDEGEEPAYFLDYTVFDDGPADVPMAKSKVKRVRTPIEKELAEAVQEIWLRMLREVRYPEKQSVGADGTEYHFSRFVPLAGSDTLAPRGWESGKIWTPDLDSPPGELARIAAMLRDYANASASERGRIRGDLLRVIESLRSKFKSRP